jgi:hypothetical protein
MMLAAAVPIPNHDAGGGFNFSAALLKPFASSFLCCVGVSPVSFSVVAA